MTEIFGAAGRPLQEILSGGVGLPGYTHAPDSRSIDLCRSRVHPAPVTTGRPIRRFVIAYRRVVPRGWACRIRSRGRQRHDVAVVGDAVRVEIVPGNRISNTKASSFFIGI
jgi:hypothetical protein